MAPCEGGRQLCPRPIGPWRVITSGGWPGAAVWECEGDRDWGRGQPLGTQWTGICSLALRRDGSPWS